MGALPPVNDLHAFLPHRQDELVKVISQLRERLAPKDKELTEVTRLMNKLQIALFKSTPLLQAPPQLPKEPSLGEFLRRRHWDLSNEISAIRAALTPKEKEFDEVQIAMGALGIAGQIRLDALPEIGMTLELEARTIKQLIVDALRDHFRDGATGTELSQYFLTVHGREIERGSISPQLTRLREDGVVEQMSGPDEGKWALTKAGGRYGDKLAEKP
jgi:hypothetical protein